MDNGQLFITFGGMLLGILIGAVGIFLVLFGYILPRHKKSPSAFWFGWMLCSAGGWAICAALLTNEFITSNVGVYGQGFGELGSFFFISFAPYTFLWFVLDRFGVNVLRSRWKWYFLVTWGTIIYLTALPWSGLYSLSEGSIAVRRGSIFHLIFGVLVMTPFLPAGWFLVRKIISGGKDTKFFQVVSGSMALTVGWIFTTNLVVPYLMQSSTFSYLGPYGLIVMTTAITYMILRTDAFQVKPLVFRVYILAVTVVVILYFEIFKRIAGISETIPAERILLGILFIGIASFVGYILILAEKQKESLEKTNEQLGAQDDEKSVFLQVTSHQLRTPVSAMRGYLDLIETDEEYIKKWNDSTGKMVQEMKEDADKLADTVKLILEKNSEKTK